MSRIDLIQARRGTTDQWATVNPVLAIGELGYDTEANVFKVGDGAAAWLDLDPANGGVYARVHTPVAFGAVGDGVTDDAAALTAMFLAASIDGRPVYLPDRTYAIASEVVVPDGVRRVMGAGVAASILKLVAAGARLNVASNRCHLSDFGIIGTDGAGTEVATNGLWLSNASRSLFDNIRVQACVGSAVVVAAPWQVADPNSNVFVTFRHCEARTSNTGFEVLDAAGAVPANAAATNLSFVECEAFGNTDVGLLLRNGGCRVWGGVYGGGGQGVGIKLGTAGDTVPTRGGVIIMPHLEDNATAFLNESVGKGFEIHLRPSFGRSAVPSTKYVSNGLNVLITPDEAGVLHRSDEVFVAKTADETISNSVALQNDDALIVPVKAGQVWRIRYTIHYRSPTAAGMKVQPSVPGASTWTSSVNVLHTNATTVAATARREVLTAGPSVMGAAGAGVSTVADFEVVVTAAADGDVVLQWAQNVADAGNTSVRAGSYLTAKRVAA